MPWFTPSDRLSQTFEITVVVKLLIGLFEILLGLAVFFVSPAAMNSVPSTYLRSSPFSQHPYGFIVYQFRNAVYSLQSLGIWFAAFYLLSHGVAKIVLGVAVMRNKLWVYPAMICYLVGFIIYQLYRMTFAPSIALGALTIFDAFITWLAFREYYKQRSLMRPSNTPPQNQQPHNS